MPSIAINLNKHWHGLPAIKHIVIFGDSYSSVGYDSGSPHPHPDEPIGVKFPGVTWTNDGEPNWVGHLITKYSQNPSLLVYDYAVGGDKVDGIKHQVRYHFMGSLANKPDWAPWTAENTLFVTWIGINDCAFAVEFSRHMEIILELQEELYYAGARNFLFVDVPPIHRSPAGGGSSDSLILRFQHWNSSLHDTVVEFAKNYADTTAMIFSSWNTFNHILNDPVAYGFQEIDSRKRGGAIWIDHIHPSSRVHDIIAHDISEFLLSQPPACSPQAPSSSGENSSVAV